MTTDDAIKVIADYYGIPVSKPLTAIFNFLFDNEDDLILIPALPGTAEEISDKTGIPKKRVSDELSRLVGKGAIMQRPTGEFCLLHILLELRDFTIARPGISEDYYKSWHELIERDYSKTLLKQRETGYMSRSRTLPINETAPAESQILEHDSLRKMIKDATTIATLPCVCRRQFEISGDRPSDCPASDKSSCLLTGRAAEGAIAMSDAKVLTTEEALEYIDQAAKEGLVHNVTDFHDDYEVAREIGLVICNCCPCCCILLHSVHLGFPEIVKKSGFHPIVKGTCTGCGVCEDICTVNAISIEEIVQFNIEKCLGCGNCVAVCPEEVLTMEKSLETQA